MRPSQISRRNIRVGDLHIYPVVCFPNQYYARLSLGYITEVSRSGFRSKGDFGSRDETFGHVDGVVIGYRGGRMKICLGDRVIERIIDLEALKETHRPR